jgi:UDP-3-O-[3-hydroxymyristoyl] glucosamine N-acyltransferase
MSDVPPGETWGGYPARGHREWLRAQAAMYQLPDLLRPLQSLIEERTRRGQNND